MAGRYYRIIINYNKLHGEKHPAIIEMKIILTLLPKKMSSTLFPGFGR
jgi:hypothetical protein